MKRFFILLIIATTFMMGCVTTGNSKMKKEIDPESPEGFKASHQWVLEDAKVIDNPEYKPSDLFSSRYLIQDNLDVAIDLNPDYLGEWKAYGMIDKVNLPSEQISAENLYFLLKKDGKILSGNEKDSNWRGIWFYDDGSVETDSGLNQGYTQYDFWGTRWTDGWVISDTEVARSHSIIYNGDKTLLFFELKNGDYRRGYAPTYMVFKKQ